MKNKQSYDQSKNQYHMIVREIDKMLQEKFDIQVIEQDFKEYKRLKRIIEERGEIEKALKESEEKYRTIFENSAIAITLVDKNERIISWNKYTEILLEMSNDDLNMKPVSFLYPEEEWKKIRTENIRQKGMQHHFETKILKKNNEPLDVDISVSVLKDNEGNVTGSIGVIKDISGYKKIERELRKIHNELEIRVEERTTELSKTNKILKSEITERIQAVKELQDAMLKLKKSQKRVKRQNVQLKKLDKIKSDFLNITSHELRTPMSSVKGYVQLLIKDKLGDINGEQSRALKVVLRNITRLDNLIQDILDISRLESGTMKFITQQTDVKQMIEETIETMQPIADLKEININCHIEEKLPKIVIDPDRIKQVIINLMNNSIKFSTNGSIINIKIGLIENNIIFEIQDFGRGIPKNKQEKIFNTFYQVDYGMDRKFGGVGLGLAISRGIVLAYGGKIWVESKVGRGSNFKFTLPLKPLKDIKKRIKS